MQYSFERAFKKDSMLMWSAFCASVLWIANAVFNIIDSDYRAFFIDLLYVICLLTLCGAEFKKERNVIQGMIGALLMVCVVGNVNVLSEMLSVPIPSRSLWQLIVGFVLTVGIFINHFMISHSKYHTPWRIKINQIMVLLLLILRCFQIILNIISGGFSTIVIEVTIGMLAIIPTMNVIVCIECRGDGYKIR